MGHKTVLKVRSSSYGLKILLDEKSMHQISVSCRAERSLSHILVQKGYGLRSNRYFNLFSLSAKETTIDLQKI